MIGPSLMISPSFAGTKFTGTSGTCRDLMIASIASSICWVAAIVYAIVMPVFPIQLELNISFRQAVKVVEFEKKEIVQKERSDEDYIYRSMALLKC